MTVTAAVVVVEEGGVVEVGDGAVVAVELVGAGSGVEAMLGSSDEVVTVVELESVVAVVAAKVDREGLTVSATSLTAAVDIPTATVVNINHAPKRLHLPIRAVWSPRRWHCDSGWLRLP